MRKIDREAAETYAISAILILTALGLAYGTRAASGHEIHDAAGKPTGEFYAPECCRSAATSPTGDCAPIDDRYVTEGADGYHINIPVGGHPKLKNKGYSGVVPYKQVRQPIDNQYHICLSPDGGHRFCFYPKPGAV